MISMPNLLNIGGRGGETHVNEGKNISTIVIAVLLMICLMTSGCMFTRVTDTFTADPEDQYGFHIPQGSIIYHWANGITEVYGPDNNRILITKDSLVTHTAPEGEKPTTRIIQLPHGRRSDWDESTQTRKIYMDDVLVLTIIEKSEKFPLISLGRFYIPLP